MTPATALLPCRIACTLAALALGGCATYTARPLDLAVSGATSLAALRHDAPLAERLTPDAIARLALDNNPDLVAARMQRGVADAQRYAASLLPNPMLGVSYAEVIGGGTPAWSASLGQDIKALVTLSARGDAARAAAQSVDAAVLWQEWQTMQKARLAAVDVIAGERELDPLRDDAALWTQRVATDRRALDAGDATLTALAPDLAALADARKRLDEAERAQAARRRDLAMLVGLAPSVPLALVDEAQLSPIDAASVHAQLADLPNRRPDLIALQLGYRAQEAKLRAAVLAQFPTLTIGPTYARDNSDVKSAGPQLSMDLPVFDRNQGAIATERATREQLRAEFEARLVAARAEVESLLADHADAQRQLDAQRGLLAQLEPAARHADAALANGDLDERSYVDLATARNAKRQDVLALERLLDQQRVAIAALVGDGMPRAEMPSSLQRETP